MGILQGRRNFCGGRAPKPFSPLLQPPWPPPLPLKVLQNLGPAFGCIARHVTGIIIRAEGGERRPPPPARRVWESGAVTPRPSGGGGCPERAAGARRLLQLANEVSCAARAVASSCVGAEGAGKAAVPVPPPLPSSGWAVPWPVHPTCRLSPTQRVLL